MARFTKRWVNRERLTYIQVNAMAETLDLAHGDPARPEDYGAIGDGTSRPAAAHLGLANLAALQAYNGGVFSFADSASNEMDALAWQAALYAGKQRVVGRDAAHYILNRRLHNRNAHLGDIDLRGAILDFTSLALETPGDTNLVSNGTFADGTDWVNTLNTWSPGNAIAPVVFGGGYATGTDPWTELTKYSFGQFGQQITLTEGLWTASAVLELSEGASKGFLGGPYLGFSFFPDHVGQGGYAWDDRLYRSITQYNAGPDTLSFDFEIPVGGGSRTEWLTFSGGNADFRASNVAVRPYALNCAIWADGSDYALPTVDACWWRNGRIIGPGMASGVRGILYKSFSGGDKRLNTQDVDIVGFSGGRFFSDQAYLNVIRGGNTGECDPCVAFQAGSVNAGENIRFSDHIFYNSGLVFDLNGGGEFNCTDVSLDYCEKYVEADRAALLTLKGAHLESHQPETFLLYDAKTADFDDQKSLTGGTSGATATILEVQPASGTAGKLVIAVLSGTFADNETITDSGGGSATANGSVSHGGVMFELNGGAKVDIDGAILFSGADHSGAQYLARLHDQTSTLTLPASCYNLKTASGVFADGAGRVIFARGHQHPGNANLPGLITDNFNGDMFMGAGRIYGPSTISDSGFEDFGDPDDHIGLDIALHADDGGDSRVLTAYKGAVARDTGVGPEDGFGSLKLEYNGEFYSAGLDLRIFAPVREGEVVLLEYQWPKPDDYAEPVYGPFANADPTAGDTIRLTTFAGSSLVSVHDVHAGALAIFGPQPGWTVAMTGVAGTPGGIANATFNATHTVVENFGEGRYTIDIGTPAASTQADVGGTGIGTTYTQTNALIFFNSYWVTAIGRDDIGRLQFGNVSYQGEAKLLVPAAAQAEWTKERFATWYAASVIPADKTLRIGNGRAPAGATHLMLRWTVDNLRFLNPNQKFYWHLGHLKGNRL